MTDDDSRYATLHVIEANHHGGESLWQVCVRITSDQNSRLESGDRLSYQEVIGRTRQLIFEEVAKRSQAPDEDEDEDDDDPDDDNYPGDYLDELWP